MSVLHPYSVEQLAARAEIHDRIHSWARGVDRKDWALAASGFHEGAIDDHGIYVGDVAGLIEMLQRRHIGITMSVHNFCNIVVEFAQPDTAVVESYALVWQRYEAGDQATRAAISGGSDTSDDPFDMIMAVRYADLFMLRSGTWKIQQRVTIFDATVRREVDPNGPKFAPSWQQGRRDGNDPIQNLRREYGLGD